MGVPKNFAGDSYYPEYSRQSSPWPDHSYDQDTRGGYRWQPAPPPPPPPPPRERVQQNYHQLNQERSDPHIGGRPSRAPRYSHDQDPHGRHHVQLPRPFPPRERPQQSYGQPNQGRGVQVRDTADRAVEDRNPNYRQSDERRDLDGRDDERQYYGNWDGHERRETADHRPPPPDRREERALVDQEMRDSSLRQGGAVKSTVPSQTNGQGDAAQDPVAEQAFSVMKGIEQGGPPPSAPRGPKKTRLEQVKFEEMNANTPPAVSSSRGRSADNINRSESPERGGSARASASGSQYRDRAEPPKPRGFTDAYLHADIHFGRDRRLAPRKTAEFDRHRKPTTAFDVFRDFIVYFSQHKIRPEDIDGHFFESLRETNRNGLVWLAQALNAASGHANGNLYHLNYAREGFRESEQRTKKLVAGAVFMGASLGVCRNKKFIGIENLCSLPSPVKLSAC